MFLVVSRELEAKGFRESERLSKKSKKKCGRQCHSAVASPYFHSLALVEEATNRPTINQRTRATYIPQHCRLSRVPRQLQISNECQLVVTTTFVRGIRPPRWGRSSLFKMVKPFRSLMFSCTVGFLGQVARIN
ncbi:hypothetical protein CSKR_104829 [Clonorchis sinensis]|uniref:Uncharacterized protein n=1 Tax=Clonorchis sinensis TaxID=79923 RepID=A0A3R7JRF5_CLOSI|nr:hypothetical protein CSKR_104829 [Clonorchis sinensis]